MVQASSANFVLHPFCPNFCPGTIASSSAPITREYPTVILGFHCELKIPADYPHVRKCYESVEARESAKAHPGMVSLLGSYSKVMAG